MRKAILLVFIITTLLLIGCDGMGGGSAYALYNPYHGSDGIEMEFLESAPPDMMYQDTSFKVGMLLHNLGAIDVDDAFISLSYLDKYYTIGNNPRGPIDVKGKSFFRRSGEKKPVYFDGRVETVDYDGLTAPITATLCYSYTTHMVKGICVDPDIYGFEERQKACTVQDLILKDQGAPVAITRVEESIIEDGSSYEVYFKIHIKNVDTGFVADVSPKTLCTSASIGDQQINRLRVSGMLGDTTLSCGKDGLVYLKDNEADVTCTAMISLDEEYTTSLKVDLEYGYSKTLPLKSVELFQSP